MVVGEQELFDLRREHSKHFKDIKEFEAYLRNLFDEEWKFPVVVGAKRSIELGNEEEPMFEGAWEVGKLSPITPSDRLTVENYSEAIRILGQQEYSKRFSAFLQYPSIESFKYWEPGHSIFDAWANEISDTIILQSIKLSLYYGSIDSNPYSDKIGYKAVSELTPTKLEECCAKFAGPNREYRK